MRTHSGVKRATTAGKSGPTAGERAQPTAGNVDDTSWKSEAYNTMRRRTHTTMCTGSRTRPSSSLHKRPRSRQSFLQNTSYCRNSTGVVLAQGCELDKPVAVRRQVPMAQTVLGSSVVAVHRRPSKLLSRRRECRPVKRPRRLLRYRGHSSWRRTHDAETVAVIQKIRKTVGIPQVQLMPSSHTNVLAIRPSRTPLTFNRYIKLTG